MRTITSKYDGECSACRKPFEVGATIAYERQTGTFCPGCAPTDTEEIRAYRQARIDAKNKRREEWAQARERRSSAAQRGSDHLMGRDRSPDGRADWALVTQPGHIPQRAKANRLQEKAWEEAAAAAAHRSKMQGEAVVKGDRERKRQQQRDAVRDLVKARVGTTVHCHPYGEVKLVRVNTKSATVETSSGFRDRVCLTWIDLT